MSTDPTDPTKPKRILSLDEILHGLSDLAQGGDGAQRTQAYRMLLAQKGGSSAVLEEPLNDQDIVELLSRVMKPAGRELCKLAYHRSFSKAKDFVSDVPSLTAEYLDPKIAAQVESIRTLHQLYRWRPRIKRPGFPPGYPVGRGKVAQQAWCRSEAIKILLDEEQARLNSLENKDDEAQDDPKAS